MLLTQSHTISCGRLRQVHTPLKENYLESSLLSSEERLNSLKTSSPVIEGLIFRTRFSPVYSSRDCQAFESEVYFKIQYEMPIIYHNIN